MLLVFILLWLQNYWGFNFFWFAYSCLCNKSDGAGIDMAKATSRVSRRGLLDVRRLVLMLVPVLVPVLFVLLIPSSRVRHSGRIRTEEHR